jgi:hypothetical protein
MKIRLLFAVLTAAAALLAGCSSTPEPAQAVQPVIQSALLAAMQKNSAGLLEAGGLAAIGTGESKSLDLALNYAKKNGRIALAKVLQARISVLEKAFTTETGIPADAPILSGFNNAVQAITGQQLAGSVAQNLKYETDGDTFIAYAVMALDPQAIAGQLAQETELYARLQPTKAFGALDQEIKAYEAFKAAQK